MEVFSFFFALVDPLYQVLSWPLAEWLDLSGILRQLPHMMEAYSAASSEQALTLHEVQLETIQHAHEGIVEHLSHLEKCLQVEQAFVHEPTPEDALAASLRNLSARGHSNRGLSSRLGHAWRPKEGAMAISAAPSFPSALETLTFHHMRLEGPLG